MACTVPRLKSHRAFCQDPPLRGKPIESEGVSNLPARRKGSLMTPNKFRNTRRDGRMIQTRKRKREKRWEAWKHSESRGKLRRESHSSLRRGQTIKHSKEEWYMLPHLI